MATLPPSVLIVGAGIAGCSAAIALAQRGARVTLIEQQAAWRFQSSGIFVYANGLECFGRLGSRLVVGSKAPGSDREQPSLYHSRGWICSRAFHRVSGSRPGRC